MNTQLDSLPEILRVKELAAYLRISTLTLKRWEKKNYIPIKMVRIGSRGDRRYFKEDLERWLNQ